MHARARLLVLLLLASCSSQRAQAPTPPPGQSPPPPAAKSPPSIPARPTGPITLSIIGTADLHGRVERTAVLAGFLKNIRSARAKDGGMVLVDAGDLFQGTLESNLNEGHAVVQAYNLLGYNAAAIGNHEFDFGPEGPDATATKPGQDAQGALKARARQANFPFLAANITPANWPNVMPTTMVTVAGVKVGIIGVTTQATPNTTLAANFKPLKMLPTAQEVETHAGELRAQGARVVVVAAHLGGACKDLHHPHDLSSCKMDEEAFDLAKALPPGTVDVLVGGHTHQGVAQVVNGIAVVESFSSGRAFGRVDITVDAGKVTVGDPAVQEMCDDKDATIQHCNPPAYEGAPVVVDAAVLEVLKPVLDAAATARARPLGVNVLSPVRRGYAEESALANLAADLMLATHPKAQVGITNGGGIRADFPAGPLNYGVLYETLPFDNRFATIHLTGADLKKAFLINIGQQKGGILAVSGVNVLARCKAGALDVQLTWLDGRTVLDEERILVVTSDFLATGGDGALGLKLPADAVVVEDGEPFREQLAALLLKRGGTVDGNDPALFSSVTRRVDYLGKRPVSCAATP